VYSHKRRPHTHDVRAMAVARRGTEEVLISGGVDTILTFLPLKSFAANAPPERILPFPRHPIVSTSLEKRFMLCMFTRHLDLWKFPEGLGLGVVAAMLWGGLR